MDLNLVSRLWKKLTSNVVLWVCVFEFMTVVELVMVQIMGFGEDERTFLTLTFMKMRLWNRRCEHLDLVVHMFAQPFYMVDSFPCNDAIITWTNEEARSGPLAWIVKSVVTSSMLALELSFGFYLQWFTWHVVWLNAMHQIRSFRFLKQMTTLNCSPPESMLIQSHKPWWYTL
jgi:hypothetical protein